MPTTALDICRHAAQKLGVYGAGESLTAEDAADLLANLNSLLDSWNANRDAVYADLFLTFPLTASLSPHTIGPTGTFVVAQRPVSIEGAGIVIAGTSPTAVTSPINLRDAAWWDDVRMDALSTSLPTDLYYDPTWPNGSLYFWPVPTMIRDVTFWTRTVLAQLLLTSTFSLPPGYEKALTLTLAEDSADLFGVAIPPQMPAQAAQARATIFSNNRRTPRLETRDAGLPGGRGTYSYLTGSWS